MSTFAYGNEGEAPLTEQRRLRHLTDVLVRNLTIPASLELGEGSGIFASRPSLVRTAYSSLGPSRRASIQDAAGGSSNGLAFATRPLLSHGRSRDDLDLPLRQTRRKSLSRRNRTISNSHVARGVLAAGPPESDHARNAVQAAAPVDVKGKGREGSPSVPQDASLSNIYEAAAPGHESGLPPSSNDDSDLVFGWTSTASGSDSLHRSRSKSSLKSISSKRSISSAMSKRFFRTNAKVTTHSDEDEESDRSDAGTPRRPSTSHRPQSPSVPHVSFQMVPDPPASALAPQALSGNLEAVRRARSASRSSVMTLASNSSASTVRPSLSRHTDKERRLLRQRRYEDVRAHLVRSRISVHIPLRQSLKIVQAPANPATRPPLTRVRTISLPLTTEHNGNAVSQEGSDPAELLYYMSPLHEKSMEPSFSLDHSRVVPPAEAVQAASRKQQVIVRVWVESAAEPESTLRSKPVHEQSWQLLTEWEVDFRKLTSLGSDLRLFPREFPPNTLIFKLSNTDEFFTARLPTFMLNDIHGWKSHEDLEEDSEGRNDGNVSDPGPASAFPHLLRAHRPKFQASFVEDAERDRERLRAHRRMIIDRSVRETRMLQSINDQELAQVIAKEQEMNALREDISSLQTRLDVLTRDHAFANQRHHHRNGLITSQIEQDLVYITRDTDILEQQRIDRLQSLNARRERLSSVRAQLESDNLRLKESVRGHQLDLEVYRSIRLSASQRRAGLVGELAAIFPIELVDASAVLYSICNLLLPNSEYDTQLIQTSQNGWTYLLDDDSIASALGYAAQAVQLLAAYLSIPLYYPIRCLGSRSLVQDPISQMKGPKVFPLYSKGVDRYRFEYAVFLLNKDIEQIMLDHGMGVMELTQTLPNLKNLYLTLSSDATNSTSNGTHTNYGPSVPISGPKELRLESSGQTADQKAVTDNESAVHGNSTRTPSVSASALEKILGTNWSHRSSEQARSQSSLGISPALKGGRRRLAESSKTMTLLGGRSNASSSHNHVA